MNASYPISFITYSKEDLTYNFILYVRKEVALFTKINEYDIYNKCKRARPLYLQIIRYFKQFNICSSPCVNRFIKTYVSENHPFLKEKDIMVLYGGSVNSKNAKEILSTPHVDGVLIGSASLDAKEFTEICNLKI